jgi:paraquat-inducible protein A
MEGTVDAADEPSPEALSQLSYSGHQGKLACHECDLLVSLGDLREGDQAVCPRCGYVLSSRSRNGLQRAIAFSMAAAIFLVFANLFPFLAIEASGLESEMVLGQAIVNLYKGGEAIVASIVFAFIVVIPGVILVLVSALAIPLTQGTYRPWLKPAARFIYELNSWSMAEVFIIGVIVSLVKIGQMATVIIGISFWAYAAFTICFTAAVASLDRLELWDEIERLSP